MFRFFIFILGMLSAGIASAEVKSISELEGATYFLFTNPKGCAPCRALEKLMATTGQSAAVKVTLNNVTVQLAVKTLDPWIQDDKLLAEYEKLGYLKSGIPQFAIVKNGQILGVGHPQFKGTMASTLASQEQFLGEPNETVAAFVLRINKLFETSDFSSPVLFAVGLIENKFDLGDFAPEKKVSKNNVMIAGTGTLPLENPIFTAITFQKVLASLAILKPANAPTLFYGGGTSSLCDTCEESEGIQPDPKKTEAENYLARHRLIKFDGFKADTSFSEAAFAKYFEVIGTRSADSNLIIFIGHGSPNGAISWLNQKQISPEHFGKIISQSKAPTVLVSGNCFGGIMANQVECGFMAAPPNRMASGCYESAQQSRNAKDYVSEFFKSLEDSTADLNQDKNISLSEAHAYAVIHNNHFDHPYTSWDARAQQFFNTFKERWPKSISLKDFEIQYLNVVGSTVDKALYSNLLKAHPAMAILNLEKSVHLFQTPTVTFEMEHDPDGDDSRSFIMSSSLQTKLSSEITAKLKPNEAFEIMRDEPGHYTIWAMKNYTGDDRRQIQELTNVPEPAAFSVEADNLRSLVRRLIYKKIIFSETGPGIDDERKRLVKIMKCENRPISDFVK